MARKTSTKSATWTDLDEIRTALPGIPLDEARALLHSSRPRFLSSKALAAADRRAAARLAKRAIWSSCDDATAPRKDFAAPVFANRTTRISGEAADHTNRLSDPRNDDAAIKKFLADGGTITVVPTRTAPGAGISRSVRAKSVTLRTGSSHSKSRSA